MITRIGDSTFPPCDKVGTILDDGNVKCFFPPISLPDKAGNENLMGLPKEDHLTLGRCKFPVPVQIFGGGGWNIIILPLTICWNSAYLTIFSEKKINIRKIVGHRSS